MCKRWLILLLIFPHATWGAGDKVFMTDIHRSEWRFNGDKLHCEMSHEIRDYGKAHFIQKAGGQLSLTIDVKRPAIKQSQAVIRETIPSWVQGNPDPYNEQINTVVGSQPFKLGHAQSSWMLNTLEGGRFGSFFYQDWDTSRYEIRVSLNTVNFRDAFSEFKACTNRLVNYTFDDLRHLNVYFQSDAHTLTKEYRERLDRIAEYVQVSEDPVRIKIYGHTDSLHSVRYNYFLSTRRADAVYNYLVRKGVSKKLLKKRVFGEKKPKASNQTLAGRARNRRVELLLELG